MDKVDLLYMRLNTWYMGHRTEQTLSSYAKKKRSLWRDLRMRPESPVCYSHILTHLLLFNMLYQKSSLWSMSSNVFPLFVSSKYQWRSPFSSISIVGYEKHAKSDTIFSIGYVHRINVCINKKKRAAVAIVFRINGIVQEEWMDQWSVHDTFNHRK